MARGFVNHCLTTNFDDLLNDAFSRFIGDTKPVVCAHDSQISQIRLTSKRPKIIKLHGDFLYESIKNTSSLSVLEDNMQRKFEQFSKEIGLVIVGYSGCDESIMGLLMPRRLLAESLNFPHGVHWCILKGQSITPKLQEILTFNRVFLYQIEDFLMAEFYGKLNSELPRFAANPLLAIWPEIRSCADWVPPRLLHPLIEEHSRLLRENVERLGLLGTE